jgi:hypothetical protein
MSELHFFHCVLAAEHMRKLAEKNLRLVSASRRAIQESRAILRRLDAEIRAALGHSRSHGGRHSGYRGT